MSKTDKNEPMDPNVREEKNPTARGNNLRACYGIKQLVSEVTALFPETTHEVSNYDGRNTGLDVEFDASSLPGLAELLSLTSSDPRVFEVIEDDGHVLVAFRPSARTQDDRSSFGLAEAWDVLVDEMDGSGFDGARYGSW